MLGQCRCVLHQNLQCQCLFVGAKRFAIIFAFCKYQRARCVSLVAVIVIFIYLQKTFFWRNIFIYKKKKKSCLGTGFFFNPKY